MKIARKRRNEIADPIVVSHVHKAIAHVDSVLDAMGEGDIEWDSEGLDHLERARGALYRVLATPRQREAEYRAACDALARDDGSTCRGLIGKAMRQHVLELAWMDGNQHDQPGNFYKRRGLGPSDASEKDQGAA